MAPADLAGYRDYWRSVLPTGPHGVWLRWVFAYMSIHTTWERNVAGYRAVAALGSSFSRTQLAGAIAGAGVGLLRNRTEGLWRLRQELGAHPARWQPAADPGRHREQRDELARQAYGIGLTKVSFAFELCAPLACGVVCLDTHLLQLYGGRQGAEAPGAAAYNEMEAHWLRLCAARGLASPLVRHLYWDAKKERASTRYWSWVFEGGP